MGDDRRYLGPVLRARLRVTPEGFEVIRTRRIEELALPGSAEPPALIEEQTPAGFWIEAQDADRAVRYRARLSDPTTFDVEFPGESGEISRRPLPRAVKIIDVLVPAGKETTQLAVFARPDWHEPDSRVLPASIEIGRLALEEPAAPPTEVPMSPWLRPPMLAVNRGHVLGAEKVLDNGPDAERYNIVLLAEGFDGGTGDQNAYRAACSDFATAIQQEEWYATQAVNLHRIDVASAGSGVNDPATPCGDGTVGSGGAVVTFFGAGFCASGSVRRVLAGDDELVKGVADDLVPGHQLCIVLVNTQEYGGSGTNPQIVWTSLGRSGAASWVETALHELGHAMGLADEYPTYLGCDHAAAEENREAFSATTFSGGRNVTADSTHPPWSHHLHSAHVITNLNCSACDTSDVTHASGGWGIYEGAGTFHCGLYRAFPNCRMRSLGRPFCAWCLELIELKLGPWTP